MVRIDVREVLVTFLRLGCTSFGGPIAHLQYFRRTLVEQRGWLDEDAYASIVAFCSILPGPTSSQVGMMLGLMRAGPAGALAAWFGFTLPSAVLMAAAAVALTAIGATAPPWFPGLLDGLLAAAAAVILQAVMGLGRSLCSDMFTRLVALGSCLVTLALRPYPGMQWISIAAGAALGALLMHATVTRRTQALPVRIDRRASIAAGIAFAAVIGITLLPRTATTALLGTIVRAGALVFGGGHVVLPLLQQCVRDGIVGERLFFAGYGIAQAMPGPLFSFSSFLGFVNSSPLHGTLGAGIAVVLIFAPSFALIFALAPLWNRYAAHPRVGAAMRGANASVVGLLAAVLVDPIAPSLAASWPRIAIAGIGFFAIVRLRTAPWAVVACAALVGALVRA